MIGLYEYLAEIVWNKNVYKKKLAGVTTKWLADRDETTKARKVRTSPTYDDHGNIVFKEPDPKDETPEEPKGSSDRNSEAALLRKTRKELRDAAAKGIEPAKWVIQKNRINHLLSKDSWTRYGIPNRHHFYDTSYGVQQIKRELRDKDRGETTAMGRGTAWQEPNNYRILSHEPPPKRIEHSIKGLTVSLGDGGFRFTAGRALAVLAPATAAKLASSIRLAADGKLKSHLFVDYGPMRWRFDENNKMFSFMIGRFRIESSVADALTLAQRIETLTKTSSTGKTQTARGLIGKWKTLMKSARLKEPAMVNLIAGEINAIRPGIVPLPVSVRSLSGLVAHYLKFITLDDIESIIGTIAMRHAKADRVRR